jgi:hypothetical protein
MLSLSPTRMEDGRELGRYPPQPVALGLIEAKRYRDRGVNERELLMAELSQGRRPLGLATEGRDPGDRLCF